MSASLTEELNVFYCYAREDQSLHKQLEQHLSSLKRSYKLKTWFDRQILPGENWEETIEKKLNEADLILLLISPAFMASDYCYNKEMEHALTRHAQGEVRVIPIHLRPVHWKNAPFSSIQMLPKDAIPVTSWQNADEALLNITIGIEKVIEDLLLSRQIKDVEETKEVRISENPAPYDPGQYKQTTDFDNAMSCITTGNALHKFVKYEDAIHAYTQAIRLNPNFAMKNNYEGDALTDLQIAEETLTLDANSIAAYRNKIYALLELLRYKEALLVCEQIMHSNFYIIAVDYNNKGYALNGLKRYTEALQACEEAIRLKPRLATAYKNRGYALNGLKRYEEALQSCEQAIQLNPSLAPAYAIMGVALFELKRFQESSQAFAQWSEYCSL